MNPGIVRNLLFDHRARVCAAWLAILFAPGVVADDSTSSASATRKIPAVSEKAPDFTLHKLDGSPVTLSKLTAVSPVVLVVLRGYPTYQCPICAAEVLGLISQEAELVAAGAHVVLVYPGAADQLSSRAAEFLKMRDLRFSRIPASFSYVTDPDYRFTLAYALRWDAPRETAYPSTFVIDPENVVRYAKISRTHGDRAPVAEILKALAQLR